MAKLQQVGDPRVSKELTDPPVYFLIQCCYKPDNSIYEKLIFAVVHPNDIYWDEVINPYHVVIKCGGQKLSAPLLYTNTKDKLLAELHKLKKWCYEKCFDQSDEEISVPDDCWFLVQYYSSTNNFAKVVHTIVSYRETVWKETNQYKDVVAYLRIGNFVHQSIVIRKSKNRRDLEQYMSALKNVCPRTLFPLPETLLQSILPKNDKQTSFPVDRDKVLGTEVTLNLDSELERLSLQAQKEYKFFMNTFDKFHHVHGALKMRQERLIITENLH